MSEQRSTTIGKLAEALAKAQRNIRGAAKDAVNPHLRNKYADLASCWDACRDALTTEGLAVVQAPVVINEAGDVELETMLVHGSGEWIASRIPVAYAKDEKGLKPMQAMGSALTYARRYGLSAMVGICPEDDDGEASGHGQARNGNGGRREEPRREPEPEQPTPLSELTAWWNQFVMGVRSRWDKTTKAEPVLAVHTIDGLPGGEGALLKAMCERAGLNEVIKPGRAMSALVPFWLQSPDRFASEAKAAVAEKVAEIREGLNAELSPADPGSAG